MKPLLFRNRTSRALLASRDSLSIKRTIREETSCILFSSERRRELLGFAYFDAPKASFSPGQANKVECQGMPHRSRPHLRENPNSYLVKNPKQKSGKSTPPSPAAFEFCLGFLQLCRANVGRRYCGLAFGHSRRRSSLRLLIPRKSLSEIGKEEQVRNSLGLQSSPRSEGRRDSL